MSGISQDGSTGLQDLLALFFAGGGGNMSVCPFCKGWFCCVLTFRLCEDVKRHRAASSVIRASLFVDAGCLRSVWGFWDLTSCSRSRLEGFVVEKTVSQQVECRYGDQ